jgi:5,10-methylenetetrahydromethanopterin reductase
VRLGFAPAGSRDTGTAVELAVQAERLGYDEVWVSEDYLERGAFTVAAGVAARTSRVRIGLGVLNPWTRHVALTAMECAALDELSGGRLIVGLGASNARWMAGMLGFTFDKPISRLAEYTEALRVLLSGQTFHGSVAGQQVSASLSFRPYRADVPIHLGVKGPVALRRGAAVADGLMLSVLASPAYVEWVATQYPGLPLTAYVLTSVADGPDTVAQARERLRPRVAQFLGVHGPSRISALAGVDDRLATELRRRLVSGEPSADLVDDELVSRLTLSGTVAEVEDRARSLARAGLDVLVAMDDGTSTVPNRVVA